MTPDRVASARVPMNLRTIQRTILLLATLLVTSCASDEERARAGERDLNGADLRDANLAGVNLSGARITQANLQSVNFSGANLTGVDFTGSSLIGANLTGAIMRNDLFIDTVFNDANMTGADLSGSVFGNHICNAGTRWPAGFVGWGNSPFCRREIP
jgi:uncharacterized protein YjbI with pentapeptide repeats